MPARKPTFRIGRVLLVSFVTFLCVGLLHAGWGWQTDCSLKRRIDSLRGSGEKILPGDFRGDYADIDSDRNAERDILAAGAFADDDVSPHCEARYHTPTTLPVDPKAWPYLVNAKEWYEPALRRLAIAQKKPRCEFYHEMKSPLYGDRKLDELRAIGYLMSLVSMAAMVDRHAGDDSQVIVRLDQLLYLSDILDHTTSMHAHCRAIGIVSRAALLAEQLTPDLRIGSDDHAAKPEQVRKLIARFLDVSAFHAALHTAMSDERMESLDFTESMVRGRYEDSSMSPLTFHAGMYVIRPKFIGDAHAMLDRDTQIVAAVNNATNWATVKTRLVAFTPIPKNIVHSHDLIYLDSDTIQDHFEAIADRRMAATALAIRLYQSDHAGRRPDRLEQLVPDYLPAVPLDSMSATPRPIGYLPRPEHPVLYSVAGDGVDQSADEGPETGQYGSLSEWRRLDRAFYLSVHIRSSVYVEPPNVAGVACWGGGGFDSVAPWEPQPTTQPATAPASPP